MPQAHPAAGVSIEYFVDGDGLPLVLVHGITESHQSWDPLIAPLAAAGYRTIAIDLRGHGSSSVTPPFDLAAMTADLGAVLDAESAGDALLVGHSLGGVVVSAFAAGGPCRGVVNVDQPLALSGFKAVLADLEPLLRGSTDEFASAIDAIFELMAGPLGGSERERLDRLRAGQQEVVIGVWDAVLTLTAEELGAMVEAIAAEITVPYLSLHGVDPGPDYAPWLTGLVGSATVEVWPDLGHYPHLIEPDRFVERLVEFDPAT